MIQISSLNAIPGFYGLINYLRQFELFQFYFKNLPSPNSNKINVMSAKTSLESHDQNPEEEQYRLNNNAYGSL